MAASAVIRTLSAAAVRDSSTAPPGYESSTAGRRFRKVAIGPMARIIHGDDRANQIGIACICPALLLAAGVRLIRRVVRCSPAQDRARSLPDDAIRLASPVDDMKLGEFRHAFLTELASGARLLGASKRNVRNKLAVLVDPDSAGIHPPGKRVSSVGIS